MNGTLMCIVRSHQFLFVKPENPTIICSENGCPASPTNAREVAWHFGLAFEDSLFNGHVPPASKGLDAKKLSITDVPGAHSKTSRGAVARNVWAQEVGGVNRNVARDAFSDSYKGLFGVVLRRL